LICFYFGPTRLLGFLRSRRPCRAAIQRLMDAPWVSAQLNPTPMISMTRSALSDWNFIDFDEQVSVVERSGRIPVAILFAGRPSIGQSAQREKQPSVVQQGTSTSLIRQHESGCQSSRLLKKQCAYHSQHPRRLHRSRSSTHSAKFPRGEMDTTRNCLRRFCR